MPRKFMQLTAKQGQKVWTTNCLINTLLLRTTDILKTCLKTPSWKDILKKCTSFEKQKGTKYIRENVAFGIIISCLSSAKRCLRILLICFAREIKGFYLSYL